MIDMENIDNIRYTSKYLKNKLKSCLFIGTYNMIDNDNGPILLNIGGNYQIRDSDSVLVGRNSMKQTMGRFISPLRRIAEGDASRFIRNGEMNSSVFFGFKWRSIMSTSITNYHRTRDRTFGTLEVQLPFVQIKHSSFAKDLNRLMKKLNAKGACNSSEDDSSSSSEED